MAKGATEQQRLARIRDAYDDMVRVAFDRFDDHDIAVLLDGAYNGAFLETTWRA